jgi:phosphoglucosamine mutase
MSNGGLEEALDGRLVRSNVGDQYVAQKMKEHQALLGAEPSGHVIFDGEMPSGDGLYAALRILKAIQSPPIQISWIRWPNIQKNILFEGEKVPLEEISSISQAKEDKQRVIVRYSGTESKLRILVEGQKAEYWVNKISNEFLEKQCKEI